MELATRYVRNKVVDHLGTKYPPASKPGEYPHLRTGMLRNSIQSEVVDEEGELVGHVGTVVYYAKYLELPEYGLDRAFLVPTLNEVHSDVVEILKKPMP